MGKLIPGFRAGVIFHTTAGPFRNGSEPSKDQAKALKEMGYKLDASKETVEAVPPIHSNMRAEQIEQDNEAHRQADIRADEVRSLHAATQENTEE